MNREWMVLILAAGMSTVGCQSDFENAPDFSLEDVNSASERGGDTVSPRDYLGQTSAWYFGHAT